MPKVEFRLSARNTGFICRSVNVVAMKAGDGVPIVVKELLSEAYI